MYIKRAHGSPESQCQSIMGKSCILLDDHINQKLQLVKYWKLCMAQYGNETLLHDVQNADGVTLVLCSPCICIDILCEQSHTEKKKVWGNIYYQRNKTIGYRRPTSRTFYD